MDSSIANLAQKYEISDLREISMFENFFQRPDITEELQKAEKYRKVRYSVMIPTVLAVTVGMLYLVTDGSFTGEGVFDAVLPLVFLLPLIVAFIVWIFRKKIEGALKEKVLPYLSKELLDDLKYDAGDTYAFSGIRDLVSVGFLNSYDHISNREDSIGFHINQDNKHIVVQGFELQTTKKTRDSKGRTRTTTTNHCYIMKVRFPHARIGLSDNLLIKSDESDGFLHINWSYVIAGAVCGYFIGSVFGDTTILMVCVLAGALLAPFLRSIYLRKRRVHLENPEFEKFFDVLCKDQVGSRMIVTPAFMDRLVKLASKKRYRYELLYQNDCFYVKWNVGSNYLEINTWKNIRKNVETFIAWYAQMRDILVFIFDMRMVYFSKTSTDAVLDPSELEFESFKEGVENPTLLTLSGVGSTRFGIGGMVNSTVNINTVFSLIRLFRR